MDEFRLRRINEIAKKYGFDIKNIDELMIDLNTSIIAEAIFSEVNELYEKQISEIEDLEKML